MCLLYMMPQDAYSITIHVCTTTIVEISHTKRNKIPLSNEMHIKAPNSIIQLWQVFMFDLSSGVNKTPKTNTTSLKYARGN